MRRRPAQLGLNLTSMIDVVFLLLVYFMAATEFKLGEELYKLDLPQRGHAADPFDLPREPLRIVVKSGRDGRATIQVPGFDDPPRDFKALQEFLRQRRQVGDGTGGLFEPDHPILIEPQDNAMWEHAIEAFNAAVAARYTNVNFAPAG
jgi:biopolymer transport protein ExbD